MTVSAPVLLDDSHELHAFDCGMPPLDEWLKRRARSHAASGASHTYIACEGTKVAGYYALAAGAVDIGAARARSAKVEAGFASDRALTSKQRAIRAADRKPLGLIARGRFRRNMPDPTPVVVLGWLAVDRSHQGKGLGRALFRDAGLRVLQAADIIGVRGLLVDATSQDAKAFYLSLGMVESPIDEMTLMVTLADLRGSLASTA